MRNIIGALSVLFLIIGATIANSCYMSSITEKALTYVDESLKAADFNKQEVAIEKAKTLDRYWGKQRDYLESVLMHNELDDITITISEFISAAENEDMTDFQSKGRLLLIQLTHLAELEKLRVGNIL